MVDVVLTLPVKAGEEALMFGRFLTGFLTALSLEDEREMRAGVGPHLMMRADPAVDGQEVKVLTFQETRLASAFAAGWSRLRGAATSLVLG